MQANHALHAYKPLLPAVKTGQPRFVTNEKPENRNLACLLVTNIWQTYKERFLYFQFLGLRRYDLFLILHSFSYKRGDSQIQVLNATNSQQRCVKDFRRRLKKQFFSGSFIYFVLYQSDKFITIQV